MCVVWVCVHKCEDPKLTSNDFLSHSPLPTAEPSSRQSHSVFIHGHGLLTDGHAQLALGKEALGLLPKHWDGRQPRLLSFHVGSRLLTLVFRLVQQELYPRSQPPPATNWP